MFFFIVFFSLHKIQRSFWVFGSCFWSSSSHSCVRFLFFIQNNYVEFDSGQLASDCLFWWLTGLSWMNACLGQWMDQVYNDGIWSTPAVKEIKQHAGMLCSGATCFANDRQPVEIWRVIRRWVSLLSGVAAADWLGVCFQVNFISLQKKKKKKRRKKDTLVHIIIVLVIHLLFLINRNDTLPHKDKAIINTPAFLCVFYESLPDDKCTTAQYRNNNCDEAKCE